MARWLAGLGARAERGDGPRGVGGPVGAGGAVADAAAEAQLLLRHDGHRRGLALQLDAHELRSRGRRCAGRCGRRLRGFLGGFLGGVRGGSMVAPLLRPRLRLPVLLLWGRCPLLLLWRLLPPLHRGCRRWCCVLRRPSLLRLRRPRLPRGLLSSSCRLARRRRAARGFGVLRRPLPRLQRPLGRWRAHAPRRRLRLRAPSSLARIRRGAGLGAAQRPHLARAELLAAEPHDGHRGRDRGRLAGAPHFGRPNAAPPGAS